MTAEGVLQLEPLVEVKGKSCREVLEAATRELLRLPTSCTATGSEAVCAKSSNVVWRYRYAKGSS